MAPILLPTAVDPVTDIRGILLSATKLSPITPDLAIIILKTPSGTLFLLSTSLIIFCTAIAVSGVLELGFHTITLPATAAIMLFHAHTATGKLNDVIRPSIPSGWYWSYIL